VGNFGALAQTGAAKFASTEWIRATSATASMGVAAAWPSPRMACLMVELAREIALAAIRSGASVFGVILACS
jgi:hypothetical protein